MGDNRGWRSAKFRTITCPWSEGRNVSGNGESLAAIRGRFGATWEVDRFPTEITRYPRRRQKLGSCQITEIAENGAAPRSPNSFDFGEFSEMARCRNRRNRTISAIAAIGRLAYLWRHRCHRPISVGNLSTSQETPIRPLIVDKNAPFSAPFRPSPWE